MKYIIFALFCVLNFIFVHSIAITNTASNANMNRIQSGDLCVYQLEVTPAADTCVQDSTLTQFTLQKRTGDPEYCVYYLNGGDLSLSSYTVDFTCFDGAGGNDSRTVEIGIIPNNPPAFSTSSFPMNVDASVVKLNDPLFSSAATDINGDSLSYNLDPPTPEVYIDGTGSVRSNIDFNAYNGPATITFNVQVTDGNSPKVNRAVTLNIQNINTAPQITNLPTSLDVSETLGPGTLLYTCMHDEPGPVTKTLTVDPLTEQGVFSFNDATCAISIAAGEALDFETLPTMTLKITLNDGVYNSEFNIPLNVQDANDPPVFTSNTYSTLTEECQVAIPTGQQPSFGVTDDGTFDYSLTPGPFDPYLSIDTNSGEISCLAELDFDAGVTQAIVEVVATDNKGLTATASLTVNVVDYNDNAPEFDAAQTFASVSPKTSTGTKLGTVVATDADTGTNADIIYTLTNNPGGKFLLSPQGGLYLDQAVLESERGTLFAPEITATDKGTPAMSTVTTIVVPFNPSPFLKTLPNVVSISEDLTTKKDIFKIEVNDTDTYTCTLVRVVPTATFTVEEKGGEWYVFYDESVALSVSTTPTFTVDVSCTDFHGGMSEVGTLTIQVTQNQLPAMDCPVGEVFVDATATNNGDTVYQILATDTDTLTYGYNFPTASGKFYLNQGSGLITSQVEMLRETQSLYIGTVTATDGFNTVSCSVTLSMTNTNIAPILEGYAFTDSVDEDVAAGTPITVFTITDPQECDTTTFTWDVKPSDERLNFDFTMNGNEVTLSIAPNKQLDYETTDEYDFFLKADDGCRESLQYPYTLKVNDINEEPTLNKDSYSISFDETDLFGKPLGCGALDPDIGDNPIPTLTGTQSDKFSIFIDGSGECYLQPLRELDRDTGFPENFQLTLTIEDKEMLSDTATIQVKVNEINDNDPICDNPGQQLADIFNGDPAGKPLGTITATDDDMAGSVNEQMTYTITSPSSSTSFIGLTSDGNMLLTQDPELQLAAGALLTYRVLVTDGGTPSRSATCTVNVQYIYTTTPPPPPTTQPPTMDPPTTTDNNNGNNGNNGANSGAGSSVQEALSNPVILGIIAGLSGLLALAGIIGLAACCMKKGCCKGGNSGSYGTNNKQYDYRKNNASRLRSRGEKDRRGDPEDRRGSRQNSPKNNQVANIDKTSKTTTTTDIYTVRELAPNVSDNPTIVKHL